MLNVKIFTLYPELFPGPLDIGLYKKARKKKKCEFHDCKHPTLLVIQCEDCNTPYCTWHSYENHNCPGNYWSASRKTCWKSMNKCCRFDWGHSFAQFLVIAFCVVSFWSFVVLTTWMQLCFCIPRRGRGLKAECLAPGTRPKGRVFK